MKKIFFILLVLMTGGVSAQVSGGLNDGLNYGFTLIPTIEQPLNLEGSGYYHENFIRGTVNIENKNPVNVYLKYNVAEERMEIKTHLESSKIYQLPREVKVYYVINSERFYLDKLTTNGKDIFGYFINLFEGDSIRLIKKPLAHFREGERAKTGYGKDMPSKISIEDEYFIITENEVTNVRLRTRDVQGAFKSSTAQEYLKKNKIKNEVDLIGFISFINNSKGI